MKTKINIYENDLPDSVHLIGDLAIDTEAMGLNLYRDRLCLVQICDSEGAVHMVHFVQDGDGKCDYTAKNLRALLMDKNRQKIFHYARFDLAIMMHYLNIDRIHNIFCTKIASKLARTYTDHHGLRTVVMELCGVELKKEQQSSNWGASILTNEQKMYAANDVMHLHMVREKLIEMLYNSGRLDLAKEYFNFLHTVCKADMIGFNGANVFEHHV
jgi:ribonuclease D